MDSEDDIYGDLIVAQAKTPKALPKTAISATDPHALVIPHLSWWISEDDIKEFIGFRGGHLPIFQWRIPRGITPATYSAVVFTADPRNGISIGPTALFFAKREQAAAARDLFAQFGPGDEMLRDVEGLSVVPEADAVALFKKPEPPVVKKRALEEERRPPSREYRRPANQQQASYPATPYYYGAGGPYYGYPPQQQ